MMGSYLYAFIIYPIEMFIETVFSVSMQIIPSAGYAILFVSIAVQALVLPIYKHADDLQEEERMRQKAMSDDVGHIKKTFKGDERIMMLSTYYRVNGYRQYYQLRAILPLLLQIPFFIAAYHFLSNCNALSGASFYFLKDMGKPDAMLSVGGFTINVMPVLMTLINIVSGAIYTKGLGLKDKLQLYITAGVFLVLLYDSPSGLVLYWTLNNVFSLLKNVFMKIITKHRDVIITCAAVAFMLIYCLKAYGHGALDTDSGRIVVTAFALATVLLAVRLIRSASGRDMGDVRNVSISKEETTIFCISSVVLAVTAGIMIPVVTVASSPVEFVVKGHYVNPLAPVLYSFLVAAGLFILWGNIIYRFYSPRAQKILVYASFMLAACSLVNSQFFRQGLRNMSMNMLYYDGFGYSTREKLINLAVLFAVIIACFLLLRFAPRSVSVVAGAMAAVTIVMSGYNIVRIQSVLNNTAHIKDDEHYTQNAAYYDLDKNGRNVVVFFEDRAFGQFLPYILNEKPELADVYSGFTYYRNTISFGTKTITGSPALYGGYEYTSYNLKDRDDEYRNNSVKLMPTLFAKNGFDTTVFDIPFYVDLKGAPITDFFEEADPNIKSFDADGVVKTPEEAARDYAYFEKAARSNFIRHSIFLSSPLMFRRWIYDRGSYLTQFVAEDRITYAGHIEELDKLADMAKVSDRGNNTFTMIENDAPHSMNVNLQMPEYTLVDHADNSEYITEWRDKLSEVSDRDGREINMNTDQQIQAYEVNMSTILSIGRWIAWLKENDLYDNTRIIIVADHGYSYFAFDDMIMDMGDGNSTDLEMFMPLLMVKDFADSSGGADAQLAVSDEFMTNADVPTLAMKDLIKDPVNPFTGNPVDDRQKHERDQYVFDDRVWLSVHDDIYDMNNWKVIGEDIR